MRLWLIERTDDTDYDETNAILVRAVDEGAARVMALAPNHRYPNEREYEGFRPDNLKITEVTAEGEPEVIIVDFLRG